MIPGLHSVALVLLLMWIAMFAASGFVVLSVTYANAVYSANHAGFIAGVGADRGAHCSRSQCRTSERCSTRNITPLLFGSLPAFR